MSVVHLVNRAGVAGAVLQSPPSLIDSFIHSLSHPFSPNVCPVLQKSIPRAHNRCAHT